MPPLEQRFVDLRGSRLRYFVGGEGAPLMLVHGLGGVACNWRRLAGRLAPRHRLLVPELPGHGGSSPLPVTPGLNAYADRIALLAELERLGPAVTVGHSLGALVALRLARRRPAAVRGVVLAGAAGISSTSSRARRWLAVSSFLKPGRRLAPARGIVAADPRLRHLVLGWGVADTDSLGAEVAEDFLVGPALSADTAAAARALVLDDVREDLADVRQPCLVLWGTRDTQVSVADAFEFARRLRAPLRLIADTGHLLIGERPDLCEAAIADFVAACDSGAARPGSGAR